MTQNTGFILIYRIFLKLVSIRLRFNQVKVKVTLQLTVSQSLCQGIEPILGLVTRYYFLSEGCFPKFAVLSFWGALSDEK
jgi:hypothetical protein